MTSVAAAPEKAFAVVEFEEEEGFKIIPTKWIVDDSAKYPIKCSEIALKKLIKNCADAESSWKLRKIQEVYCKTSSFPKAEKILALVKDASDIESDPSGSENGLTHQKPIGKRQRKIPSRYILEEESPKKSATPKAGKGSNMKTKKKLKDTSDMQSDSSDSNNCSFSHRKRKMSYYVGEKVPSRKSMTHRAESRQYYQEMLNERADSSFEEEDYVTNALYKKKRKTIDVPSRFSHPSMGSFSSDEERYAERTLLKDLKRKSLLKSPAMLSSLQKLKNDSDHEELKQLMVQIITVQEKTYLKLKELDERQKRLQTEVIRIRDLILKPNEMVEIPHIPDDISLPVYTDESLEELNEKLANDKELQTRFVNYLYHYCFGRNVSSFMTSCLKKIMTQNVAQLYSRLGRKGKKSFMSLSNLYAAVIGAATLKFPEGTPEEFSERLGRTLASSGDWEGRKPPITITVVKQPIVEEENC